MGFNPSPAGTYSTPDGDENNALDTWLADLAEQVELKALVHAKGSRKRIHWGVSTNVTAGGSTVITHGAGFTPAVVIANTQQLTTDQVISVHTITATQFTVVWATASGAAVANGLNRTASFICLE